MGPHESEAPISASAGAPVGVEALAPAAVSDVAGGMGMAICPHGLVPAARSTRRGRHHIAEGMGCRRPAVIYDALAALDLQASLLTLRRRGALASKGSWEMLVVDPNAGPVLAAPRHLSKLRRIQGRLVAGCRGLHPQLSSTHFGHTSRGGFDRLLREEWLTPTSQLQALGTSNRSQV